MGRCFAALAGMAVGATVGVWIGLALAAVLFVCAAVIGRFGPRPAEQG